MTSINRNLTHSIVNKITFPHDHFDPYISNEIVNKKIIRVLNSSSVCRTCKKATMSCSIASIVYGAMAHCVSPTTNLQPTVASAGAICALLCCYEIFKPDKTDENEEEEKCQTSDLKEDSVNSRHVKIQF